MNSSTVIIQSIYSLLLNPEEEDECGKEMTEDSMVKRVIVSHELSEVADDDDDVIPLPIFEQQLASVALVKRMCNTDNLRFILQSLLGSLQRSMCLELAKKGSQTTMTKFQCCIKKCNVFDQWDSPLIGTQFVLPRPNYRITSVQTKSEFLQIITICLTLQSS